jgi:enamine deaminase RidA (YjgF/YER057c/UK114 family)
VARLVNPSELGAPLGYTNGVVSESGRLLFVAGQVGWDKGHKIVGPDFLAQFEQALDNFLVVVRQAGGRPESIVQMRIFVTDKKEYLARLKDLGVVWKARMGRHYPAMSLVQVSALLEDGAKIEIEGTAAL